MLDVIIVGAGPVGLFMGALLLKQGHQIRILDRRLNKSHRSRAIGIHPPALTELDRAGLSAPLLASGVRIERGVAYSKGKKIAELPFTGDPDFPFILAVPQPVTEQTLEQAVLALDSEAIIRGADVRHFADDGGTVSVRAASPSGEHTFTSRLLVAADGAHSLIRQRLLPGLPARSYPDSYLMGDFIDGTGHGDNAVLYLEPEGIVESFPLPGDVRRWVVRLGVSADGATAADLAALVQARTGAVLDPESNSMLSAFDVRSRLAGRMIHGRTVLLGDAAHEISPIGGQGMNLGWLDAAALAPLIDASLRGHAVGRQLQLFEKDRRRAAARASLQASLNMALGRPLPPPVMAARNSVFTYALEFPTVSALVERRFTMR